MANEKYNGWNNYETWNVALWLSNDQGTSEMTNEWAQECYDEAEADSTFTREERAQYNLADRLKEYVEENNPLADHANVFADLLNAALSEVDWSEIAENLLSDVEKTETVEEN